MMMLTPIVFAARGVAQGGAPTETKSYSGPDLFATYCATCHGASGKGDGVFAGSLRTKPADLTRIAINNGGVFSRADVARIIDGRDPLKGHGGKDMPLWGDAFANSADGPDAVKQKIETLVSFIESLQQKP
jgi:mono/diheme cytochrome c family protein